MILGRLFVDLGYKATIGETYGVSQRGGSVMSHLRVSSKAQFSPLIPEGHGDLIIALEPVEGLRVLGQYGNPEIMMIANTRPVSPMSVLAGETQYPALEDIFENIMKYSQTLWTVTATEIALQLGNPILANMAILGAVETTSVLPVHPGALTRVLEETLPEKQLSLNLQAFELGKEFVQTYND
jgi:indolepyruvate ferredoxin oxidoreductase beta subunit